LVLANFENPGVKALCEKAAEKNLALMIARDLSEPYMSDYLGALEAAIDNLPELIMRKARSPIPMIIGQIKEKNTKGMANVKDSQVGVRMAVTQMFDKVPDLRETLSTVDTKREINAEAVQETFVHEISHKLSFQHDHDGKLLFPREDWLDLMRANGVEYLIVMNERQKEMMRLGHTMSVPPTDIEDLPEDPDEFLEALKSQLRSHVTYASDPVELVAFSAQNEDLSLNDPKGYNYNDEHDLVGSREILSRNMFCEALPASGDNIYRIWEFDGKKWQSSFIEK